MGNIAVSYNGSGLNPVPTVSQEYKFIDYNGTRYGNILELTLNGFITGITSTSSVQQITNIFSQQFGQLIVSQVSPSQTIYNWSNLIIEDISFPSSHYYSGTILPYTIKAHVYNVPSGVTEPINEYAFNQNNDGTVTVTHKVSARGIKTSSGAFTNAVNFVKQFTGKQPFSNCASYFIPTGYGVLQNLSERADRLNGSYSVTETYKYNTGSNNNYISLSELSISDAIEQTYITIDYSASYKGSPIYNNLSTLDSAIANTNVYSDISGYGINTGLLILNTHNITRNSGEASYDVKLSFLSGFSNQDLTGFFDYTVSLDKDLLMPKESWKIEGDFVCRGPISYKQQQLSGFKALYGSDWRTYLVNLISGSPIFTVYHTTGNYLSTNPPVNIQENTGLASFHISLSIDDGGEPNGLNNPKYTVDVSPSIWNFELLPAANIEGHYIVQDLQMKRQSRMNFSISAESQYPYSALPSLTGFLSGLANTYVNSGFLMNFKYNTGINDLSCSSSWMGQDNFNSGFNNIKMVGSNSFNWVRQSGYYFGY